MCTYKEPNPPKHICCTTFNFMSDDKNMKLKLTFRQTDVSKLCLQYKRQSKFTADIVMTLFIKG